MTDMTRKFWTPERDSELKRHKAAGLSASEIAALLHTTRGAGLGRSTRVRNLPSPAETEKRKRLRVLGAEARRKAGAEQRAGAIAEARQQAYAQADKNF